jgi:hypothetical protein
MPPYGDKHSVGRARLLQVHFRSASVATAQPRIDLTAWSQRFHDDNILPTGRRQAKACVWVALIV